MQLPVDNAMVKVVVRTRLNSVEGSTFAHEKHLLGPGRKGNKNSNEGAETTNRNHAIR